MTAAPSKPLVFAPVIKIARPVIVQMTIVSIKVPVIDTSPCSTHESVCAAAAAIGALPKPLSLEKIPLLIPIFIATPIPAPKTALISKAEASTVFNT